MPDRIRSMLYPIAAVAAAVTVIVLPACRSAEQHRQDADAVAYRAINRKQQESLGRTEPITITPTQQTLRRRLMIDQKLPHSDPASMSSGAMKLIDQWPDRAYFAGRTDNETDPAGPTDMPLKLSLVEALQIAAANNRDYQRQKELVFQSALSLDLEDDAFRLTWAGVLDTLFSADMSSGSTVGGVEHADAVTLSKRFHTGARFTGLLAIDLVKLLTRDYSAAMGIRASTGMSIPLLRGSGRFVVTEPLTQAHRDVVYSIYTFERFKRTFAVRVASDYLTVLQQLDQVRNAEENYRRVATSTRRAKRLADAGRLPEIQVDQARQDDLRARNRWITALQSYERRLDNFKLQLGLPTDARIELDRMELDQLVADERYARYLRGGLPDARSKGEIPPADAPVELNPPTRDDAGPLELEESKALALALEHRLDLRTSIGRIVDAQRGVAIAADDLRADMTLLGSASWGGGRSLGSAGQADAQLRPELGSYSALLSLDLPLERTSERNSYRNALISMEQAVRSMQQSEDQVKLEVRDALRTLLESRESLRIQAEAVAVARRRVESTNLFLQAGRADVRDVLEAEEALISAMNSQTSALVNYRVAELQLQRDLGVLQVNEKGLWQEFDPMEGNNDNNP